MHPPGRSSAAEVHSLTTLHPFTAPSAHHHRSHALHLPPAAVVLQRSMTTPRSPGTVTGVADHRHVRRKRSRSPHSPDGHPPPTRRRTSSVSAGYDSDSHARHHARRNKDKYMSREDGGSHASGTANGRQGGRHAERRPPHHRSRSRSWSAEVVSRRRRSRSQSFSRSPPPRRRRSRSERDSQTPPRRHRRGDRDGDSDPHRPSRRRDHHRDEDHRAKRRRSYTRSRSPPIRSKQPLPSQLDSFRGDGNGEVSTIPEKEKEKINWKTTGLLAAETNTVQVGTAGKIVLKYNEPPDARKPPASARWRLYIFDGADTLGDLQLSTQSCWLIGREVAVADLALEHSSSSKQHAVIQFRYVVKQEKDKEMGLDDFLAELGEGPANGGPVKEKGKVRPYLLDLDSTNGTYLNGDKIGESRYVELREKDIIKFGLSDREYVVLKE